MMNNESALVEESGMGPITINRFGENFFYNINRNSFDKTSAQVLFENYFGKTLFNEDALNVIVGTDSGLLPKYVQNNLLPKGSRYIFIEPDPILQALKDHRMLDDLDEKRIVCISLADWPEAIRNFKIGDYFYIQGVQSFNAICAQEDHIQEYAEISWLITELLTKLNWQNTIDLGSEGFISKQISNLAYHVHPAKTLENAFLNKTLVLLAGGPSLNEALPWVRQHRRKFAVFAVSRISRQLIQAGIEPDFVFSVDPQEISFDVSKEMLNFSTRTIFVCSYHVAPALISQWTGLTLYLGARLPWKSALNVPNLRCPGPTVTNTALSVAHDFGFTRIILAGVDFCFTKDGVTHAKGSNEELAGPRFNLTSLQVETNDGFMAPTGCDYLQASSYFAYQAKRFTSNGRRIINISGNAARIENVEYIPLAEIELDEENLDVAAIVSSTIVNQADETGFYMKSVDDLKRAQYQVKAIARLAENARRLNEEMYNSQGFIDNYKDKQKLDQIEKKFKRDHREFSKLVKKFGIRSFIKLAKPFTDEEWTAEEAKQLGNVFYDAYKEGATKLSKLIEDAIDRINARLEENADIPDFAVLFAQCRKDRSFGRVKLWREKYKHTALPANIATTFHEFEAKFLENLNNKNTRHFVTVKKSYSSLISLKQRACLLFKHKKMAELQDLSTSLDKYDDQIAAMPYRHLIDGYLAELQNQPNAAMDAYQQIIEGGDILLEETMTRIAGIGIDQDDIHTANLALECLSQINPVHLPLYAEMQSLRGESMLAIDAYNRYIHQFPEDTLVQIKLAMFYVERGSYDAAELMLDYILGHKPNLQTAITIKNQLHVIKTGN